MERFEGNGAECMVRFIADGCKGEVKADMGRNKGIVVVCPKTWEMTSSFCTHPLDWLAAPCTYTPPEPVWRDATNREALLAYLIDKGEVEYQITEDAPIEMDRAWHKVTTDYTAWTDPYRRYRIREDA